MNLRHSLTAAGTVLSLGAGGLTFCLSMQERRTPARTVVSQAGRDQAAILILQGARRSVYLRTETLALVPVGNELAQALQRKVSVSIELPLGASLNAGGSQLPRILMDLGAVVAFKSDAIANYCGTLLVVDDQQFLYSASPLTLSAPGAMVSYVMGQVEQ
jgi:hypothetical protein